MSICLRLSVILVLSFVACAQQTSAAPSESEHYTVIRAGTLINGRPEPPRHNQLIVIRGNRVDSVSDRNTASIQRAHLSSTFHKT